MSLGIVVDDTVHFLSKYLRAHREKNYTVTEGMRYAFNTVAITLMITIAVLVSCFLVLATSDFLLLPPLLSVLDAKLYKNKTTS